jgi:uncharacterized protein DUF4019
MKEVALCAMLVMVAVCSGCGGESNPEAEKAAIAAAENWLGLVDGEKYAESWQGAAPIFKGAVTEEEWV